MQNTNVSEIIAKVQSSTEFGGAMYTQEQVIAFLKMVQCTNQEESGIGLRALLEIESQLDSIQIKIENLEVDKKSAELRMGYDNRVELYMCEIEGTKELLKELDDLQEYVSLLMKAR